jgi:hypothetical protein
VPKSSLSRQISVSALAKRVMPGLSPSLCLTSLWCTALIFYSVSAATEDTGGLAEFDGEALRTRIGQYEKVVQEQQQGTSIENKNKLNFSR